MIHNSISHQNLEKYKEVATGKIIKFHFSNNGYYINYEYVVDNKKYIGSANTSYFKCDDGSEGCVGKEFKVYYSSKNPNLSDIDLGKFNDRKDIKLRFW